MWTDPVRVIAFIHALGFGVVFAQVAQARNTL